VGVNSTRWPGVPNLRQDVRSYQVRCRPDRNAKNPCVQSSPFELSSAGMSLRGRVRRQRDIQARSKPSTNVVPPQPAAPSADPVKPSAPVPESLLGKVTALLALYAVFFSFSGWTYFDTYYRSFGLSPRWVDLPYSETLTKGFTVLLYGKSSLWLLYPAVLLLPVIWDFEFVRRFRISQIMLAIILLAAIPAIFYQSSEVAAREAARDKGDDTRLPVVTFKMDGEPYEGKVLLFRSSTYFLHDVKPHSSATASGDLHILTALPSDKVSNLKIVEPGG